MPEEEKKEIQVEKGWVDPIRPYATIRDFMCMGLAGLRNKGYTEDEIKLAFELKKVLPIQESRKRYLDYLMVPEFHLMSETDQAEAVGVDPRTIKKWGRQVPVEYMAEALKKSREEHAARSIQVDSALFKEAVKDGGDAKHKELFYRRVEGWNPKTEMELTRGVDPDMAGKTDRELLVGLLASLPEEERVKVLEDAKNVEARGGVGVVGGLPGAPGVLLEGGSGVVTEGDEKEKTDGNR